MPFTMICPGCKTAISLPKQAAMATCPKCLQTFRAVDPEDEPASEALSVQTASNAADALSRSGPLQLAKRTAPIPDAKESAEENEETPIPSWFSPWGVAAFSVATLSLLQASTVGIRSLTIILAVLGAVLVYWGVRVTRKQRLQADRVWFSLAGTLSGVVLLLALFAPGILNGWWALDKPVPKTDPNKQVAVPREKPMDAGRPLSADEWVDAANEGIRQDDFFLRVESVKAGRLPGKGATSYLLVHMRFAYHGNDQKITLEGFGTHQNEPILTDRAGHSFAFQEQRLRKQARGAPTFETSSGPQSVEILPISYQDVLLVFASPPPKFESLLLEIPSSAWGRQGMCKLRIAGYFDPSQTTKKQ